MKRYFSLLFATTFAAGLLAAAEPDAVWQFAPPDAKAFVGIHWRNVSESQIGRALKQQIADAGFANLPIPGVLKDIDEAIIASPGKKADDPEEKQPPVLIRVTGRFHAADFEKMMASQGAHAQLYKQKHVYRHKKEGDMALTLLDDHTFLLGDAPSVFAALDRLEYPSATPNPLLARAAKLRDEYDIWALFTIAPTEFAGRAIPNLPLIDDAKGMELGIGMRDGLNLRIGLETGSDESAAKLTGELQKALKLAAKDMASNGVKSTDLASAAKKVQIAADKSVVRLTLRLDAAEVERSLAEARKRSASRSAVAVTMPRTLPQLPPEPPRRQTIHIEGLDDGPKDIPLGR